MKLKFEVTALDLLFGRIITQDVIGSLVPQHHAPRTIVALRYVAFEGAVVERMIFDFHRESLSRWIEACPLRDRPAHKNAPYFQAEVVVETRGIVTLYAKKAAPCRTLSFVFRRPGLGSLVKFSFLRVFFETHNLPSLCLRADSGKVLGC